jgi:hypothetical protein
MSLFNQKFHLENISEFKARFKSFRKDILADNLFTNENVASSVFSDFYSTFESKFKEIEYSSKSYYWLLQLDKLNYLYHLHLDYKLEPEDRDDICDEILEYWEESEFGDLFFEKKPEKNNEISTASRNLVPMLENQIISIFYLHLIGHYSAPTSAIYIPIQEFGESNQYLFLGKQNNCFEIPTEFQNKAVLNIGKLENDELILLDDSDKEYPVKGANQLRLFSDFYVLSKDAAISKRVQSTLEKYRTYLPFYYDFLKCYTSAIVNICDEDMVSHSTEELPGFTFINFGNRSDVELIDDLIHENGHHFLNTFLAQDELFEESSEAVFFSPWRKTLRPIRGIYHAYCTFMWAAYLFHDLLSNEKFVAEFSSEQLAHFKIRLFEELKMLEIAKIEMQKAFKEKSITVRGKEVLDMFDSEMNSRSNSIKALWNSYILDKSFSSKINEFESQLLKLHKEATKDLK